MKSNGHPPLSILYVFHSGTVYENNIKPSAYNGNANILYLDSPPLIQETYGPYLIPYLAKPTAIEVIATVDRDPYIIL